MKSSFLIVFFSILFSVATAQATAAEKANALPAEAKELLTEIQGSAFAASVEKTEDTPVLAATTAPTGTASSKANPAENEIPLHLEKKNSADEQGAGATARIVMGFMVLIAMAGGAWYLIRRTSRPGPRKNAPQIKILNQHWLGPKKSLAIIRVAGESILIGITDQNINLIKPLSLLDEEVPEETPIHFDGLLDRGGDRTEKVVEEPEEEEFQIGGLSQIKDVVHRRLRNMRSLE